MKYSLEDIYKLIKPECEKCDIKEKYFSKTKCKDCNFSYGSDCFTTGFKFCNIGLGGLRKHHFYYLLHHLELYFKFPELPDVDNKGRRKENYERWQWEVHHDDHDPTNDSKANLYLMLKTEHDSLHLTRFNLNNNPMKRPEVKAKASKSARKRQLKLFKEGNHNFQKEGIIEKLDESKREEYRNGTHPFQKYDHIRVQNLARGESHYRRLNQQKVREYIEAVEDFVILTDDVASSLGYKNLETFRTPANKIIKRYSLPYRINVIRENSRFNGKIVEVRLERIK